MWMFGWVQIYGSEISIPLKTDVFKGKSLLDPSVSRLTEKHHLISNKHEFEVTFDSQNPGELK